MVVMLVIMIFLSIFLIMLFLFSFFIEERPAERLQNYFAEEPQPGKAADKEAYRKKLKDSLSAISQKSVRLFALRRYNDSIERKLKRADMPLNPEEFIILMVATAVFVAVVSWIVTQIIYIALFAGIVMWFSMNALLNTMVSRRIKKMNEQLADALDLISASLRMGYSFMKALEVSSNEMSDPIAKEFRKVVKESALGLPTEKSLDNLSGQIPTEDMKLVKTGVIIQRQVGGNLAEVLDNISATIRSRMEVKREVRTLTAQGRISGFIIALIPIFLVIILLILDPAYLSVLLREPIGRIMTTIAIINEIIGFFIIRKIISIEY